MRVFVEGEFNARTGREGGRIRRKEKDGKRNSKDEKMKRRGKEIVWLFRGAR